MKIVIGSDHAGLELKEYLKGILVRENYEVIDYGTDSPQSVDYPDYGFKVAKDVAAGAVLIACIKEWLFRGPRG